MGIDPAMSALEVTIYPVYAFGLVVAALLTSQGPPPWVLVLQAGISTPRHLGTQFLLHFSGVVATSLGARHHRMGSPDAVSWWELLNLRWLLWFQSFRPLGSQEINTSPKCSGINLISLDSSTKTCTADSRNSVVSR